MRRQGLLVAGLMAAGALSVLSGSAVAADDVTVGQNVGPNYVLPCQGPLLAVQTSVSSGASYVVPSTGVITSWQTTVTTGSGARALEVLRSTSSGYTIVGNTTPTTVTAGAPFNQPTRIAVESGDLIGLYVQDATGNCVALTNDSNDTIATYMPATYTAGTTIDNPQQAQSARASVSAVVEPDTDGDGYGDTTQDQCPTDATTHGTCPTRTTTPPATSAPDTTAPDTTFLKAPKQRVHKRAAVFRFRSSDQVQSFQCSIDDGAWKVCSSPVTKSFRPGKHTFAVRAIDSAGNADATPAVASWRFVPSRGTK